MKRRLVASLACGLLVIAGLLTLFGLSRAQPIDAAATGKKPVVEINLIDFDPAVGDVHARIHLRLPASMISQDASPTHDLVMVDATNTDESILKLSSHDAFSYYDGFINARYQVNDPGTQFLYPFDEHITYLHFFVADRERGGFVRVPVAYDCSNCSFDGFTVTVTDAGTTPTDVRLKVTISRTTPIVVFAVFIGIAMWAMTIVVGLLAARVVRQTKKAPEVTTMGFIGGLLFAFPAIRSAQPRVPPMGVFSDYLAFFWCEFILMFTLVVVMVAWVRYPHEEDEEKEETATTQVPAGAASARAAT
jgi:hypothetical protein